MDYKIDYDAEYWDVVGNRKFTCYSEEDARWLCNFLNNEDRLSQEEIWEEIFTDLDKWSRQFKGSGDTIIKIKELSSKYILVKR